MVQMKCDDTIVAVSHDENTVSKSRLFQEGAKEYSLETLFPHKELLTVLRKVR